MNFEFFWEPDWFSAMWGLKTIFTSIGGSVISLICYVLWSMGVYTVAQRRQVHHAWFGWIPVLRMWMLGCLSDQYQYVTQGRNKSRRKTLLALDIVRILLTAGLIGCAVLFGGFAIAGEVPSAAGILIAILVISALLLVVAVWFTVLRFMALYDLYTSMDPADNSLFLVLSIVFRVTEPFFLFFNRNKDRGMPPRRSQQEYRYGSENTQNYV